MKIGVSMWSYVRAYNDGRLDIAGFIHEAKRAGADGVELLDFFYRDIVTDRHSAAQALRETGLPCPIFSISQNFAKPTEEERRAQLDKIKFGVDEALLFDSQVVRVYAGDVSEGITFDQARAWIVEGLSEASKYAHSKGIRLALENHGTLAGRGEQVKGLIEDVRRMAGNDALGANPDTGNFLIVNQPSHEAIREVAKYAYMVHFKDFAPEPPGHGGFAYTTVDGRKVVGTAVGEGTVDLAKCIRALKDAGFDGWLSVEYEGDEDPLAAVRRSIENARKFL
ncbi:MAG: sugar phosphate isomerase/epimerase [Chlorobia bacterium]|nr:sugar phosphate isomerase/epimerase [Fimbriimonadaceae bacterium]